MIKEAVEEVKNNLTKLPEQGKKCSEEGKKKSVECFKCIHGDIECTDEERKEWETKMTAVMKKRALPFNPTEF
jgi:hypothetical protein